MTPFEEAMSLANQKTLDDEDALKLRNYIKRQQLKVKRMTWREIRTAPKEGNQRVLIYSPETNEITIGMPASYPPIARAKLLWMPLPLLPK